MELEEKQRIEYINEEYPRLKQHARDTHIEIKNKSPFFNRLEKASNELLTGVMEGVW